MSLAIFSPVIFSSPLSHRWIHHLLSSSLALACSCPVASRRKACASILTALQRRMPTQGDVVYPFESTRSFHSMLLQHMPCRSSRGFCWRPSLKPRVVLLNFFPGGKLADRSLGLFLAADQKSINS
ncbi:hypothetical protein CRV24_001822 [Beauveria bassiana]|nr:hypothetical protein CRV24_001822 [Beauveria bassiana]